MMKSRIMIAPALAVLASATAAKGPISISSRNPTVARISYDDVNVHSASGLRVLQHRIRLAAEEVCREPQADPMPVPPVDRGAPCYKFAVGAAMAQLDKIAGK